MCNCGKTRFNFDHIKELAIKCSTVEGVPYVVYSKQEIIQNTQQQKYGFYFMPKEQAKIDKQKWLFSTDNEYDFF